MTTIRIPYDNRAACEAKLQKLAAKAVTLDCTITWSWSDVVPVTRKDNKDKDIVELYYDVDVVGEAPRLAGWSFLGTLSLTEANGVIRRMVPGITCPSEALARDPSECDHCGHRRKRTDTFIVQSEKEGVKVVGRSCLRDFLGHKSPEHIVSSCGFLTDLCETLEEKFGGGGSGTAGFYVKEALAIAFHFVAKEGFKPAAFGANSTHSTVREYLWSISEGAKELRKENPLSDLDHAQAEACVASVLANEETSDFMHNLRTFAASEYLTSRSLGFVCAMVPAFDKDAIRRAPKKAVKDSEHMGVVGERTSFGEVLCTKVVSWETQYGTQFLFIFSKDGDIFTWKTSSFCEGVSDGVFVNIEKATVKAHSEYEGRKQTDLARVKYQVIEKRAAA